MGEVLVQRGLLSPELLERRLAEHRREGAPLGRILMAHGDVTRLQLWDALAQGWQLDSIDLIAHPPEPSALDGLDSSLLLAQRWVPVRIERSGGRRVATVAVCDEPDDRRRADVARRLDVDVVQFVATTDWDVEQAILAAFSDELVTRAAYELAEQRPELSAADPVATWQKAAGLVVPAALLLGCVLDWRATLLVVLLVLNLVFAVGVAFKLVTCVVGMAHLRRRPARPEDAPEGSPTERRVEQIERSGDGRDIPDHELPTYTILVPAYREANVVSDVVEHVAALDYPLSKLQVLLLLEADDTETIAAAKAARPPDFVRLVIVPPGGPQTKPKACNVGLALAEGEFLVIYDAEDRPEPGQLREVVAAFRDADDDTVCVQARLNYFNTTTNILTRMFTLEYSFWFDYMLPGLDALGLPIPLGGTSNHFRVSALRDLGGWDPFNVTEDADLGVRASALGLKVGIIDSTTWEEACSEWHAWIRQRTRWIKGYMVTTLVQLRDPIGAWRKLGVRGMFGLVGLIAGTPAMFLAAPLMWAFFLYTFLGGVVPQFALPAWTQTVTFFTLVIGNGAMVALTALAARRRRNTRLMGYALLNPAYWVLHSIAAWRALLQLVVSPSHWEKTPHGIVHGPDVDRDDEVVPEPALTASGGG
jgi:cellulose synthase/poly-beta-1,6-N-acetylglucosamine synthase-like glycosyltransferase